MSMNDFIIDPNKSQEILDSEDLKDSEKTEYFSKNKPLEELLPKLYRYLSQFKVLSRREELKLFERYRQNKDQEARKLIELHNMRLVISVAKKFKASGVEEEDLINFGYIGMNKAIDKFDTSRGNKFSTCATWWIRQTITRSIADTGRSIRIPNYLIDATVKYKKTVDSLSKKLMRSPNDIEVCWSMGIKPEKLDTIKDSLNSVKSLDHSPSSKKGDDGDSLIDTIIDDCSEFVNCSDLDEDVVTALNELPEIERKIVVLKYLADEEYSNEKIGEMFNMSKVKVSTHLNNAMKTLRESGLRHYS